MRETMILILILIATTAEGRDLILSAPLEPVQSTTVHAGLNGQIRDIRVQMGNMVAVGDTLAVIHHLDLELKKATALILLKKIRAEEKRLNEMYKRGLISAHQLEIARYDTEAAHYHYLAAYTDLIEQGQRELSTRMENRLTNMDNRNNSNFKWLVGLLVIVLLANVGTAVSVIMALSRQ